LASVLLLRSGVELYELKLRGLSGPFNRREIIHLFRVGLLNTRVPCRLRGESAWRTLGEFFPLLEYRIASYYLPEEDVASGRRVARLAAGVVIAIALAAGAGWLFWPASGEKPLQRDYVKGDRETAAKTPLAVARN
jgi:hypothetical protein